MTFGNFKGKQEAGGKRITDLALHPPDTALAIRQHTLRSMKKPNFVSSNDNRKRETRGDKQSQ